MVLRDSFLEWAHVHGHRYGTSRQAIEERMAQGADVILEIDFQGAINIKRIFANAVLIFILPPSWDELRSRLQRRGEDAAEVIELRLKNAALEMAQAGEKSSLNLPANTICRRRGQLLALEFGQASKQAKPGDS